MADERVLGWDDVDIDETITETDLKSADRVSRSLPVGVFICTIKKVGLVEKNFKEYSCAAVVLPFEIESVLEIERAILDEDKKPLNRNGEPLMKVMAVSGKEKDQADMLYQGILIRDEVNLYSPKEKPASKDRRLFVAKKIGILDETETALTGSMWQGAEGRRVIIKTEWNHYTDKEGNKKKTVRVGYSGYEHIDSLKGTEKDVEIDLSEI